MTPGRALWGHEDQLRRQDHRDWPHPGDLEQVEPGHSGLDLRRSSRYSNRNWPARMGRSVAGAAFIDAVAMPVLDEDCFAYRPAGNRMDAGFCRRRT